MNETGLTKNKNRKNKVNSGIQKSNGVNFAIYLHFLINMLRLAEKVSNSHNLYFIVLQIISIVLALHRKSNSKQKGEVNDVATAVSSIFLRGNMVFNIKEVNTFFRFFMFCARAIYGSTISCNYISSSAFLQPGDSCLLKDLSENEINNHNNLILSIQSKTRPKEVVKLYIKQFEPILNHIPSQLFSLFSNLQDLTIHSEIKEITTDDFVNAVNLKTLNLRSNGLKKLSVGTFQSMKLNLLYLLDNEIETIDDFTFSNQSDLASMYLGENELTIIKRNTLAGLKNLKELHLNHNDIQTIENGAFADLSMLTTLNLDHNKIKTLNDLVFDGLISLEELSVAQNQIEKIGNSMWMLTAVKSIRLNFNKVEDIDFLKFSELPKLEKLYVREIGVKLERARPTSPSSSPLTHLDLGFNNLTEAVHLEVLGVFPNLTKVVISGNSYNQSSTTWQNIQRMFPKITFIDGSKIKWAQK